MIFSRAIHLHFFLMCVFSYNLYSDVITLQRGDLVGGKIQSETPNYIIVNVKEYRVNKRFIQFERKFGFDKFYTAKIIGGPTLRDYVSFIEEDNKVFTSEGILSNNYKIGRKQIKAIQKTRTVFVKMKGESIGKKREMLALSEKEIILQDFQKGKDGFHSIPLEQVSFVMEGKRFLVEEKSLFVRNFRPSIGVLFSPSLPMGSIATVLGAGIGARLFADFFMHPNAFEFLKPLSKSNIDIYTGVSVGYQSYKSSSSDFAATVSIIPVEIYTRVAYPLKLSSFKLSPYMKLGTGVGITSLEKEFNSTITNGSTTGNASTTDSSTDALFLAGLGVAAPVHKHIQVFLESTFMMAFEKTSAQYVNITIGGAYAF